MFFSLSGDFDLAILLLAVCLLVVPNCFDGIDPRLQLIITTNQSARTNFAPCHPHADGHHLHNPCHYHHRLRPRLLSYSWCASSSFGQDLGNYLTMHQQLLLYLPIHHCMVSRRSHPAPPLHRRCNRNRRLLLLGYFWPSHHLVLDPNEKPKSTWKLSHHRRYQMKMTITMTTRHPRTFPPI